MAGFRDLLSFLLGWWSAPSEGDVITMTACVVDADVFVPGAKDAKAGCQ